MTRLVAAMRLLTLLAIDTVRSSLLLVWDVLSPKDYSDVRILRYATEARSDLELLLLSIAVTLTPGTLVMDLSDDRRELVIHAMYGSDPEAILRDIRERVERPLLTALRGAGP
jgi:multicomponent Na+:H+ antiporter subunit E